ncbi:MAG: hypothetical protein DWQ37_00645 [Planctomycetota bacterium]|nr:MAG: hypothetical protein DWQ37_00645 [Planctomycetota bacterium]
MAKKKSAAGANKSDAIRKIIAENPKATRGEIRAKLQQRGVKASDALINKIKYNRNTSPKKPGSARTSGKTSKADAIRGMFSKMGHDARSRDVIAALKSDGVVVTSAQVSTLRRKLNENGSRGSKVGAVPYDHLIAAKHLAQRLGGVDKARRALDSFAELVEA